MNSNNSSNSALFASIFNLSNTILGSGMLAMPSLFELYGLINAIIILSLASFLSFSGLYYLSKATIILSKESSTTTSEFITFETLAKRSFKFNFIVDLIVAFKCFGVSISYLIIIGQLLSNLTSIDKSICILGVILFIFPICFIRKLDNLKIVSVFALLMVVYLCFVVFYNFLKVYSDIGIGHSIMEDVQFFTFSKKGLAAIPIFIFSFTCHQNIITITNSLEFDSKKIMKSIVVSICTGLAVYLIIGIFGYLTYKHNISSDIILMYPNNKITNVAKYAIVALQVFSYPLQIHPCRISVLNLINRLKKKSEYQQIVNEQEQNTQQSHYLDNVAFFVTTFIIVLFSTLLAIVISDFSTVLSIVGAVGSTSVSFIFPGLFYWKINTIINQKSNLFSNISPILLMCFGIIVFVVFLAVDFFPF